jgi:archaellum biogenesis ATPase FlaH
MRIPGISELTEGDESLLPTLFLLEGPLGAGKREYCTQFIEFGLSDNALCIFISARLTENQLKELFYKIDGKVLESLFKFINPLLDNADYDGTSLNVVYNELLSFLKLERK